MALEKNHLKSERERAMLKARQERKTYQEIGDMFGISRERVRQIGKTIPGFEMGSGVAIFKTIKTPWTCPHCGTVLILYPRRIKVIKYCSRKCWSKVTTKNNNHPDSPFRDKKYRYHPIHRAAHLRYSNDRMKKWYRAHRNDPNFIKRISRYNKQTREKRKLEKLHENTI